MHCKPEERRNENKTFTKFYNLLIIHCEARLNRDWFSHYKTAEMILACSFFLLPGSCIISDSLFLFRKFFTGLEVAGKTRFLLIVTGYESVGLSWITVSSRRTTFGDWRGDENGSVGY